MRGDPPFVTVVCRTPDLIRIHERDLIRIERLPRCSFRSVRSRRAVGWWPHRSRKTTGRSRCTKTPDACGSVPPSLLIPVTAVGTDDVGARNVRRTVCGHVELDDAHIPVAVAARGENVVGSRARPGARQACGRPPGPRSARCAPGFFSPVLLAEHHELWVGVRHEHRRLPERGRVRRLGEGALRKSRAWAAAGPTSAIAIAFAPRASVARGRS